MPSPEPEVMPGASHPARMGSTLRRMSLRVISGPTSATIRGTKVIREP